MHYLKGRSGQIAPKTQHFVSMATVTHARTPTHTNTHASTLLYTVCEIRYKKNQGGGLAETAVYR